ncbi:MAG: CDP-alcohol phosphatidyltransferase family protein [Actinomycetota bacterium]
MPDEPSDPRTTGAPSGGTEGPPPVPRVRDMPQPRENESVSGPLVGRVFRWPYRAILAGLLRIGVRPWHLTVASVVFSIGAGWSIIAGAWVVGGVLVLFSGLCDVFDGSVARYRGEQRRSGAFLDSVLDRVSDMVLFGSLFWALSGDGETLQAALALATLVISVLVSHLRAEAEAAGVQLTEGVFQRLERVLALLVGLWVPGAMLPVLVVLTALGGLTVLQRLWSALTRLGSPRTETPR